MRQARGADAGRGAGDRGREADDAADADQQDRPHVPDQARRSTEPVPLLFLIADTGGGHRSAARAVGQALDQMYSGRFVPVLCDPLGGPGSAWLLRWVTGLYGPAIRLAPWLWGAAYHATNSRPAMALLQRTLLALADRPAIDAAQGHGPAAIVSFHPLTGPAAVAARDRGAPGVPVATVVTDMARAHAAWHHADVDLIIAPPAAASGQDRARRRGRWAVAGPPVTREFWSGPLRPGERGVLRRSLGLSENDFLVLLAGGGEGSGGIARRAAAILRWFADVDVIAVCGRNTRLKREAGQDGGPLGRQAHRDRLHQRPGRPAAVLRPGRHQGGTGHDRGGRVLWHADAAHLAPARAGEGQHRTGDRRGRGPAPAWRAAACHRIGRLRENRDAVGAMAAASALMGQPGAASDIARRIAGLVSTHTHTAAGTIEAGETVEAAGTPRAWIPRPANGVVGTLMGLEQQQGAHHTVRGAGPGARVREEDGRARGGGRRDRVAAEAGRAAADRPVAGDTGSAQGATQLGISFRPLQAASLGLDPGTALDTLLTYPFRLIRLAAYWNRLEPGPGRFEPGELDRMLDAAERAGKQVIVCVAR